MRLKTHSIPSTFYSTHSLIKCIFRRMHLKMHSILTLSGTMSRFTHAHKKACDTYLSKNNAFNDACTRYHILSSSTSNKPSTKHLNTSTHNNAFPLMNNELATTITLRNTSNTPWKRLIPLSFQKVLTSQNFWTGNALFANIAHIVLKGQVAGRHIRALQAGLYPTMDICFDV